MTKTTQTQREKRATTHGQQDNLPLSGDSPAERLGGRLASTVKRIAALMNSLAEHLCGRMAPGALREVSRFLTRKATRISCVDGHVVLLVVVRTVPFPDDWPPMLPTWRCAINQPCVDMKRGESILRGGNSGR